MKYSLHIIHTGRQPPGAACCYQANIPRQYCSHTLIRNTDFTLSNPLLIAAGECLKLISLLWAMPASTSCGRFALERHQNTVKNAHACSSSVDLRTARPSPSFLIFNSLCYKSAGCWLRPKPRSSRGTSCSRSLSCMLSLPTSEDTKLSFPRWQRAFPVPLIEVPAR